MNFLWLDWNQLLLSLVWKDRYIFICMEKKIESTIFSFSDQNDSWHASYM
jgi:hypothetical protein